MGLIGRKLAVDIVALVDFSRIGSKLTQIGWNANPCHFTSIGHRLAIFANPRPIQIELDWLVGIGWKNSGPPYIGVNKKAKGGLSPKTRAILRLN